jgi:hypothetical protein
MFSNVHIMCGPLSTRHQKSKIIKTIYILPLQLDAEKRVARELIRTLKAEHELALRTLHTHMDTKVLDAHQAVKDLERKMLEHAQQSLAAQHESHTVLAARWEGVLETERKKAREERLQLLSDLDAQRGKARQDAAALAEAERSACEHRERATRLQAELESCRLTCTTQASESARALESAKSQHVSLLNSERDVSKQLRVDLSALTHSLQEMDADLRRDFTETLEREKAEWNLECEKRLREERHKRDMYCTQWKKKFHALDQQHVTRLEWVGMQVDRLQQQVRGKEKDVGALREKCMKLRKEHEHFAGQH